MNRGIPPNLGEVKDRNALVIDAGDFYEVISGAGEEVRKERQKDMRYICGNPWEDDDRKARLLYAIRAREGYRPGLPRR